MDCDMVAREEIPERYLSGRLKEEDRDAFEAHYFECARCFDELQTLQTIREELPRTGHQSEPVHTRRVFQSWAAFAGVAAAILLAIGAVLWTRPSLLPDPAGTRTPVATPATESQVEAPPDNQRSEPATASSEPSLERLARVDPAVYEPLVLRSAPDESTRRFQRAMEEYRKGDYRAAVAGLSEAADLDPGAVHTRFFLGVSHLLLRQHEAAIRHLGAAVVLGDSAYLEEAHWYLAKAFLQRKDISAAEAHLKAVIALQGTESEAARRLLTEVQQLPEP